ncbi:methylated-DNA-[protein]-cysteine S-methyltransferase [Natranaerovirga pectinivora]|uniref:Methylated-DNA--protein-cysteine methyltransferase n=1 Tax=Natranaerovirga pectinivora TaxID=682400 RepID=A0A4R3ML73_9FIRM|nr:methylated-DNA--[protein]-cysteine S-methyltransferase [Natranaerovirga pectinivora]TCT14302.1 methylated-DNA-[protein]-cysteine S-methyltransferase [Natranaerovirga pectinivora]
MKEDNIIYRKYLESPIGILELIGNKEYLTEVNFINKIEMQEYTNPILELTATQLREYFLLERDIFDIPLQLDGTDFRIKVWNALKTIPYGKAYSYKDIAILIGNEKACRAVGNANNKNPIPIIIPCHRVIGANGQLVGYGGGLHIKKYLLELEKSR